MGSAPANVFKIPAIPKLTTMEEERRHRKERLTALFRLFAKFGFDEGVTGHITARDPERPDHFWVNPFGLHFRHIRVSDLILVNAKGEVNKKRSTGRAFHDYAVLGVVPNGSRATNPQAPMTRD